MIYSTFYKISCKDEKIKDCYIGQTKNFNVRKNQHKNRVTNETAHSYNYRLYSFIRENGGWNNFKMEIIERIDCKDKVEVGNNERRLVECHNGTLNSRIPNRSKKEYQKEYRERIKEREREYKKEYHKKNKEKIYKRVKEYRKNNWKKHSESTRKYREENKEQIKERWHKGNITYPCFCGASIKKYNLKGHIKTKTHLKKVLEKLKSLCEEINSQ